MKRILAALMIAATFAAVAGAQQQNKGQSQGKNPPGQPAITQPNIGPIQWRPSLAEGLKMAAQTGKPLMVDFYADWCGWCKKLDRDVYSTTAVQQAAANFINVKVDTDKDQQNTRKYRVSGLPTVVFMRPDGTVIEQFVGYRGPEQFVETMNRIAKDYKK